MAILHVLTAVLRTVEDADDALRALRRALPRGDEDRSLLLLCDLANAQAARLPGDDALIRRVQSGVMSMACWRPHQAMLLVRRRAWGDAERMYLGREQPLSPAQTIAQLLADGRTETAFECASFAPGTLKGRFDAVLLADISLSCTPGTPARMARRLVTCSKPCLRARVCLPPQDEPPLIAHLIRSGFVLSPGEGGALPEAQMFAVHALTGDTAPEALNDAEEDSRFVFVCGRTPDVPALLALERSRILRRRSLRAALPLLQVAVLLLCAGFGFVWPALAALLLPELRALRHLRAWPGALVRAALLPMRAAAALDAFLALTLARSPKLRLMLPKAAQGAGGGLALGLLLLALAWRGVRALPLLLPLALLWMAAPLIVRALSLPASERIPLTDDELALLCADAETAYYAAEEQGDPCQRMLCACCGCLLGILEPDEAARRAQHALPALAQRDAYGAQSLAALLASAQFFREHMAECDAALRDLPARLEAQARAFPPPEDTCLLGAFLRAALAEDDAAFTAAPLRADAAGDALFLPLVLLHTEEVPDAALPLLRPHTYVRRRNLPKDHEGALAEALDMHDPLLRLFCLTSSAEGRPFEKLFLRSPIVAPYAALLAQT